LSSEATRCAIPGNDCPVAGIGISLNACPGRSIATTRQCCASKGATSRHEWVADPVPWMSKTSGASARAENSCTCHNNPLALMKRLFTRLGQSSPSTCQSNDLSRSARLAARGQTHGLRQLRRAGVRQGQVARTHGARQCRCLLLRLGRGVNQQRRYLHEGELLR